MPPAPLSVIPPACYPGSAQSVFTLTEKTGMRDTSLVESSFFPQALPIPLRKAGPGASMVSGRVRDD